VLDHAITAMRHLIDTTEPAPRVNPFILRQVHLRGPRAVRRLSQALALA
jgi:hypothetical protein